MAGDLVAGARSGERFAFEALLRLLIEAGIQPNCVTDHALSEDDARVVVLLGLLILWVSLPAGRRVAADRRAAGDEATAKSMLDESRGARERAGLDE